MRILLGCVAGMSTSLVVSRMQKLSESDKIWAVSSGEIISEALNADVLLLGPQLGYRKDELVKALSIPVGVIKQEWYGLIQAQDILDYAYELYQ